jgi:hypothetical protein
MWMIELHDEYDSNSADMRIYLKDMCMWYVLSVSDCQPYKIVLRIFLVLPATFMQHEGRSYMHGKCSLHA